MVVAMVAAIHTRTHAVIANAQAITHATNQGCLFTIHHTALRRVDIVDN